MWQHKLEAGQEVILYCRECWLPPRALQSCEEDGFMEVASRSLRLSWPHPLTKTLLRTLLSMSDTVLYSTLQLCI